MKTLLRVDASMRQQASNSRKLLDFSIDRLKQTAPYHVITRDLAEGVPLINEAWIEANFTDLNERSDAQHSILAYSDTLVSELRAADVLLIGLPIYNFHAPAAFKAWIDLIARTRETFSYTPNGPKGLLDNKKAYIVFTSGGTKLGSSIDFVSNYIQHVLSFIGIQDVTLFDATAGRNDAAMQDINKALGAM